MDVHRKNCCSSASIPKFQQWVLRERVQFWREGRRGGATGRGRERERERGGGQMAIAAVETMAFGVPTKELVYGGSCKAAQVSEQVPVCSVPARSATEAVAMKSMSKEGEARWQGQSSCKHLVPLVVLSTEPGSLSLSLSLCVSRYSCLTAFLRYKEWRRMWWLP